MTHLRERHDRGFSTGGKSSATVPLCYPAPTLHDGPLRPHRPLRGQRGRLYERDDPVHWFLNDRDDTRSNFYLEDAATEFQVQGLELDWACVAWDADFRFATTDWSCHSFVSSRWNAMKQADRRNYPRNAYRVLLTRARQGMVIFVPPGDSADPTRAPQFYDGTFDYLKDLGIGVIEER